jgi:hypothetical protein
MTKSVAYFDEQEREDEPPTEETSLLDHERVIGSLNAVSDYYESIAIVYALKCLKVKNLMFLKRLAEVDKLHQRGIPVEREVIDELSLTNSLLDAELLSIKNKQDRLNESFYQRHGYYPNDSN